MKQKDILCKKTGLILGAIIVLYTLVGFFILPILGKNMLQEKLSSALNREVLIEKIAMNPYALTAAIDALVIKEKDKTIFFLAQKIGVNLSLSSLFTFTLVVSDISFENPYVNIIRNEDGSFNFSDLLTAGKTDEKSVENEVKNDKEMISFILKNVSITQGEFRFEDKAAKVSHLVNQFSFSLPFLSSKRKNRYEKSSMDIDFVLNKAGVNIHVESTPFAEDLATQVHIKTLDIDVMHYLSYLPIPENIVLKNAGLNLELQADFQKKNSNNSLLLQGKVNILNVDVKGAPEEDIIKFPTVAVDISSSDIFLNQLNVSKILMAMPELNLSRDKTGKLNLLNYIPPKTATQEKEEGKKPADPGSNPFVLTVSDVEIKDAAVLFQDFANENQFQTRLFPLSVRILNFEAGNRISGEYRLKVETEAKETITSDGRFQTHPVQADGTLELSHILFDKYAPYYENLVNFDVKSGSMNFSTGFEISQNKDKLDIKIKARDFLIQSLAIIDQYDKEEIINIPEFTIKDSFIDVGNKKINTGTIRVQNGNILLKRLKDGQLNLVKSVLPVKEIQNPVNTPVKTNAIQDRTSPLPWAVTMNAFDMTGFNVQFADLTPTDPVRVNLSNISIKAEDLESFGEKKGRVDAQMNWNDKGQIRIKGSMIPAMLKAELDLGLEKIDIKSLQPYFTDSIRILVTDGDINTAGKLKLDMGTQHKTDFKFIGETSITNFICLDKQTATDFFNCNSLYLSGLSVSVFPADITVKDISLTDFYSRIIVSNTGEINLKTIFKKKAAEDQGANSESMPEKTLSEPPQINIESVTLQGGDISFSDHFTQPNFAANMKQIAGSLTGLSSDEQSRAKLHLQGLHGQSSPLDIVGTINPLAKKTFADIDISFKDIELTRFTPYSSKYLGYKIEKGKLILDLEYRIDGKNLKSENRVRFDNFTLGEKVESEHATSLPVSLAISLLKNRNNQINLDLPVTGELDDPEFKIGSIIFKMITNLIVKVVTSPFSIIGSMFGGGEELAFVDFEYGKAKIADSNYEKIDKLAQILVEKPSINLEIQGLYDPLRDAEGLRAERFEDLIKTVKLKESMALGSASGTLKQVVIKKEDMENYIQIAYDQAQFPKPRDEAGLEKELDVEEKKKLLITNIAIGPDDLRQLSINRSESIKEYLLSTGRIEKERIFLLEPAENKDSNSERAGKVKFSLK